MDLLRTARTYSTRENALRHLERTVGDLNNVRYLIAVNEQGRYAPVVVGAQHVGLAHHGITVVG